MYQEPSPAPCMTTQAPYDFKRSDNWCLPQKEKPKDFRIKPSELLRWPILNTVHTESMLLHFHVFEVCLYLLQIFVAQDESGKS